MHGGWEENIPKIRGPTQLPSHHPKLIIMGMHSSVSFSVLKLHAGPTTIY
jgi:hypothetical protein